MEKITKIFTVLGNETRLKIVEYLFKNGESICADISNGLDLAQPTMCHHYRKLEGAGIIHIRKEKTTNYYSLNTELLENLGLDVSKIFNF